MSAADRWCIGIPPQPPHVPTDGALIDVTSPRPFRVCRACWRRWTALPDTDPGHTKGEQ